MQMQLDPVVEAFFSHQGEGPNTGRFSFFVRLAGCGIGCSWCDTKYAWGKNGNLSYDQVAELYYARRRTVHRLVLTGGEPADCLSDDSRLVPLAACLHEITSAGVGDIEVETTGFTSKGEPIKPDSFELLRSMCGDTEFAINLSPKLPSAGVIVHDTDKLIHLSLGLLTVVDSVVFKFAVDPNVPGDVEYIRELIAKEKTSGRLLPVWLMPVTRDGTDRAATTLAVSNIAVELGVHFSARQHVTIHGANARGV